MSQDSHGMYPECTRNVPGMFLECIRNVPGMHPECVSGSTCGIRSDIRTVWLRLIKNGRLGIGLSEFRRHVQYWAGQAAIQAAQEEAGPSRGPLERDRDNAVHTKTLDSLQNAMDMDEDIEDDLLGYVHSISKKSYSAKTQACLICP